jgi:hypothetical protein
MEHISNSKVKRFGILLIFIGAFIPSILYPFTSLSNSATLAKVAIALKGGSYETSMQDLEVVFMKGTWIENRKDVKGHYEGRLAIPYKYALALGILLAFMGIGIIVFHKEKNETN